MTELSKLEITCSDEYLKTLVFERFYAKEVHIENSENLKPFAHFIGSWDMEVFLYDEEGKVFYHQPGEWTFFWILDGRAIQDVLIGPNIKENLSTAPGERRIGTSIRCYDILEQVWRVSWYGITANVFVSLKGGLKNNEIILEGTDVDGSKIKWMFTDIQENYFQWNGYTTKDGENWRLEQKMFAIRKKVAITNPLD